MMMEITFKTLDRVTVNGLYNKNTVADITNFVYCVEDNTYYLLDDPIVLQKREDIEITENGYYKIVIKDEAKVSIITCDTLKEVYKQLINRLARNDLNPFILYKKYKEGYITGNVELDSILASVGIPDDVIEEMIKDIAKAEENHPEMLIYISIDILKGIDEVLKKIKENQELLKGKHITVKDIVNDLTVKGYKSITYPRYHTLVRFIEELINDEKKKLERLMKKQEQQTQQQTQQQQGTTNQSSSGQQQQLEGGSGSAGTGSNIGTNTGTGMQGSPSPNTVGNNNNNNSNGSGNIGSSSGSGSGVGSLQLYAYTFRVIVSTNLKRSEVNEIIAFIKRIRPDAKVEVV
jgi:hypothetical protein